MKAVILAGGLGTRLRPLTDKIPKALLTVKGKTITEHVFDILKRININEAILSIGYKAEQIKEYFGDGSKFGLKISYIVEKEPLGTAGWMNLVNKKDFKATFAVVNGDNLFDLDLKAMLEFHKENNAFVTIALTKVDDPSHFGVVELKKNKIIRFVEKPKKEAAPSNLISSGYYLFEQDVFDFLHDERKIMLEKDIFPVIAKEGRLFGFADKGQWFDTGDLERYEKVKREWKGVK